MSSIITDLSPDDLIVDRITDEMERVIRWTYKTRGKSLDILDQTGIDRKPVIGFCRDDSMHISTFMPKGTLHWRSPTTGDTWRSIRFESRHGDIIDVSWTMFYFWQTEGSAGYMIKERFHLGDDKYVDCITCYSSHCLLRYRERMGLSDLTPYEAIVRICTRSMMSVPLFYTNADGRLTLELITPDGVFRGIDGDFRYDTRCQVVSRMKTFLSWDDLKHNRKVYEDRRNRWQLYLDAYSTGASHELIENRFEQFIK